MTRPAETARVLAACAQDAAAAHAPDLAARLLSEALRLSPNDPEVWEERIANLLDSGRPAEALTELNAAHAAGVLVARANQLRAVGLERSGQAEKALQAGRAAAADRPLDPWIQLLLARLETEHGDLELAEAAADEAVRLSPSLPDSHLAKARVALKADRREDAIVSLRKAVALAPDDSGLRTSLGIALIEAGSHREGQQQLVHVLSRFPHHPGAARALLASRVTLRGTRRKIALKIIRFLPLVGAAIGAVIGLALRYNAGGLTMSGLFYGLIIAGIGLALLRRKGTTPETRIYAPHAKRALTMRHKPPQPRTLRRFLLAGIPVSIGIGVAASVGYPITSVVGAALFSYVVYAILAFSIYALLSHTRGLAPPPSATAPFDASVCNCFRVSRIDGSDAEGYATHHLRPTGRSLLEGIGILECPETSIPWLWFEAPSDELEEGAAALVRVSRGSLEIPDSELPGQYL
jgi:Flp pilus assembly protein TadD